MHNALRSLVGPGAPRRAITRTKKIQQRWIGPQITQSLWIYVAEFDYLNLPVNHTFPNGSFLGTTANVAGTFGIKGIAGVSVLNETLNVNFIPVSSSRDATVAGATLGGGVAWQPSFLQGFGLPVALNFEYQHTWWQDAHFDAPAASPAFNYTFRRQDDLFKFGVTVALSPSAPTTERPIPVKARPSK
jgi:hypothetical protein